MKRAPLADFAVQPDAAAHQFHKTGRNGETESGAAVAARHTAVSLSKFFKNDEVLFRRDADAGIGNSEMENEFPLAADLSLHPQHNFSPLSELDCIAHKIHEDLTDTPGIADDPLRNVRLDVAGEFEGFFMRAQRLPSQRLIDQLSQIELHGIKRQLSRFDFSEIQCVVDHP